MKNKIKYILAGCCLMTTFSCSDFLERYPLDKAIHIGKRKPNCGLPCIPVMKVCNMT